MSQISFDEETSRRLERLYRTRDALRRRRLVREAIAAESGAEHDDVAPDEEHALTELLTNTEQLIAQVRSERPGAKPAQKSQ